MSEEIKYTIDIEDKASGELGVAPEVPIPTYGKYMQEAAIRVVCDDPHRGYLGRVYNYRGEEIPLRIQKVEVSIDARDLNRAVLHVVGTTIDAAVLEKNTTVKLKCPCCDMEIGFPLKEVVVAPDPTSSL